VKNKNELAKLIKTITASQAAVLYTSIAEEIDLYSLPISAIFPEKQISLPTEKTADPFVWAEKYINRFDGLNVCVFIPGKLFDKTGTRHGRGGGWYDRFLSKIPKRWIRIGVTSKENFSLGILKREKWDEPMDWVLILNNSVLTVVKTGIVLKKKATLDRAACYSGASKARYFTTYS